MSAPVISTLPADLPTNWTSGQIVSPNGTEVGLTQQHGYNYLGQQVNAAQTAINQIAAYLPDLSTSAIREVVDLTSSAWQSTGFGFQQVISVDWMTTTMQVDLATDPQTDAKLAAAGIRIVPVNAAGTLYAAIYGPTSPTTDIQVQLTGIETEVTA